MTDMKHMLFLEEVALSDIEILRYKESTYRGSWKAGGGRSAWFMVRRMLDRLLVLMKKPEDPPSWNMQNIDDTIDAIGKAGFSQEIGGGALASIKLPGTPYATQQLLQHLRDCYVAENVFAKIRETPSGTDGTVLAVLRDFRRYALLIEAEMISRGVVESEKAPKRYKTGKKAAPVETHTLTSSELPSCTHSDVMREERRVPRYSGVQHADPYPWPWPWQVTGPVGTDLSEWYRQVTPTIYRLEPVMSSLVLPATLLFYYVELMADSPTVDRRRWILDMSKVPEVLRDCFPKLQIELNAKEWEENQFAFMYELDQSDGKYKLGKLFQQQGWGRDA